MAADAGPADGAGQAPPKGGIARFIELAGQALPAIGGAVGFLGFVAAVGGAIEWTRFSAAGLPADQAVRFVPKQELVAIGATALAGFTVIGLLAVLMVYVLDSRGEASAPVRRGLGFVVAAELAVAIVYADLRDWETAVAVGWLVVLTLIAGPLLDWAARALAGSRGRARRELELSAASLLAARDALAAAADRLAGLLAAGAGWNAVAAARDALGIAAGALQHELRSLSRPPDPIAGPPFDPTDLLHAANVEIARLYALLDDRSLWRVGWSAPVTKDVWEDRAYILRVCGTVLLLAGVGAALTSDRLRWLALMVAVALVLAAAVLGVANATTRFGWYGFAAFLSVPLFGAALSTDRTFRDPKVQPAALVRKSSDLGVCGVYVTQSSDRVYLGRIQPAGKGDAIRVAGRIFWVPLSDVDVVSVGPLQDVVAARWRARGLLDEVYADRPEVPAPVAKGPETVRHTSTVRGKAPNTRTIETTTTSTAATTTGPPLPRTHPPDLPADACTTVDLSRPELVKNADSARRPG